jgi:hypothetical protein
MGPDEDSEWRYKLVRRAWKPRILLAAQCMYRLLFANDFSHVLGSRSYVSGLLIDTRVVAVLGLRTRRGLISGKVQIDRMGRQTLGA